MYKYIYTHIYIKMGATGEIWMELTNLKIVLYQCYPPDVVVCVMDMQESLLVCRDYILKYSRVIGQKVGDLLPNDQKKIKLFAFILLFSCKPAGMSHLRGRANDRREGILSSAQILGRKFDSRLERVAVLWGEMSWWEKKSKTVVNWGLLSR